MGALKFVVAPAPRVSGELRVPSDKSISHRAVMLSAMCEDATVIEQPLLGADVRATVAAVRACGAEVDEQRVGDETHMTIRGGNLRAPAAPIDCGNAGTLIRLFAGLAAGQNIPCELSGDSSLSRRPMRRIIAPLRAMGADIRGSEDDTPPLIIGDNTSPLNAILYHNTLASAQVKSAILFATLGARGTTAIAEPVISRDHTEKMLAQFGVSVRHSDDRHLIAMDGGQPLRSPGRLRVPADMSSAFFFIVGAAISPDSDLTLTEVGYSPARRGALELLMKMGADIDLSRPRAIGGEEVVDITVRGGLLHGIDIGAADVPAAIDEMPALCIAAACAGGVTRLRGAAELRHKESDRIAAMAAGLAALGARCEESADGITIEGKGKYDKKHKPVFDGGEVGSAGDHRIAMAFAIASLSAKDAITITDCDNVDTSFPDFARYATTAGIRLTTQNL